MAENDPPGNTPNHLDISGLKAFELNTDEEVTAAKMEPKIAAGIDLVKIVLSITFISIIILSFYLMLMEIIVGGDVKETYTRVLTANRPGNEIYVLSSIDRMISDLRVSGGSPNTPLTQDASQNIANVAKLISGARSIPVSDRQLIEKCVVLPADATRLETVARCIAALERVKEQAIEASVAIGNPEIASDFATKILAERQSLRNFWIQAAQLILLNLLLPLLTALLGYIFGTQQSTNRQSGS